MVKNIRALLGILITLSLGDIASADPVRFLPGDTAFKLYLPGLPPPGVDGIDWCANYVGNPISPTCITGTFPGAGQPVGAVHPAEIAETGYRFDLCFRWHLVGGGLTDCPDPGVWFPTMIETYRSDGTSDGGVGTPDFRVWEAEWGCNPSGCSE